MICTQVFSNNSCIFGVDGIFIYANREGPDGFVHHPCSNGTNQAGIKAAAAKKSYRNIGM